jgi:DNA polymerase V
MECAIGDVWGIGRRLAPRLIEQGINTAWDFIHQPRSRVRSNYTIEGERTWRELQGEVCYKVDEAPADRQSITVSRTFGQAVTTFDDVYEAVANFVATAAVRLRRQNSVASSIMVYVKSRGCDSNRYMGALQYTLPVATDSTIELLQYARRILVQVFRQGEAYKKAGVIATRIMLVQNVMRSLFEDTASVEKEHKLTSAVDAVNKAFGRGTVKFAVQGSGKIKSSSEKQSPHYTTEWSDIPVVTVK